MSMIGEASGSEVNINQEELTPVPAAEEQEDIYRGDPPSPPRSRPPSVTSSSSAGRSILGLRRGKLGTILEMAINRWARASSDSSSVASSSTSLRSRMPRRRIRPSSVATSHNAYAENIILARRKAWQQGRAVPREFVFFLPTILAPQAADNNLDNSTQEKRVFRSATLPPVLSQLESAIKRSARQREKQPRIILPGTALDQQSIDNIHSQRSFHAFQGEMPGIGKNKTSLNAQIQNRGRAAAEKSPRRPAWWLDVSSPTWSDMLEIGKLLHLHPLTLEDILHQEPREKFEVFQRLGYYFIVFRALDNEHTRSKACNLVDLTMKGDKTGVPFTHGEMGVTNVYIVVFREGICTFHFEDISDHILRVRNRIMQFEDTFHMSSDWIAHGILDSIVDQFFPLLNLIELEIKALDDVILSINGPLRNRRQLRETISNTEFVKGPRKREEKKLDMEMNEKVDSFSSDEKPMWFFRYTGSFSWGVYVRRLVPSSISSKLKQSPNLSRRKEHASSTPPLMRMASARRVVTSLTRLLNTKADVVSQIRKRLAGNGLMEQDVQSPEQDLAGGVVVYFGDIQDHILSLQQSLAHYERMLSHSHPAYISHIRVSLAQAKAVMDYTLFRVSLLTVAVLANQVVIGVFSSNVSLPRNNRSAHPPAPFNYFMGIIAFLLLLSGGVMLLARYWWRQAEHKFARARQSKNRSWLSMF